MSNATSDELAAHAFATGLTTAQVDALASLASATELTPGHRLFDEDEPATRLWLIRAGRIALDLRVPGRDRLIVETLGPGDELGLSWLAPDPRWQFGAIAQLPTSAFELHSADLISLCEADHDLGYRVTRRLLETAISRLQAARIRIIDLYAPPGGVPGNLA